MRTRALIAALALLPTLAACDSAEEFIIGGDYRAVTGERDGLRAETVVTVPRDTESGSAFSFTATVENFVTSGGATTVEPEVLSGTGRYDHPTVTLSVEVDGVAQTDSGTVSDDGETIRLEIADGRSETFTRE